MSFAVAPCPISVEITSTVRIKSKGMLFISEIPLPFFVSNLEKILGPSGPGSPLQWNTFWLMAATHMDNINNVPFSPYQQACISRKCFHALDRPFSIRTRLKTLQPQLPGKIKGWKILKNPKKPKRILINLTKPLNLKNLKEILQYKRIPKDP